MTRLTVLSFMMRSRMMGTSSEPIAAMLLASTGAAYCTVRNQMAMLSPTVSAQRFRKKPQRNSGLRGYTGW